MLNPNAEDLLRAAQIAEDNGDKEEAEMLFSRYRQSLPTLSPPAEHIPKMPPRWEPKAA